MGRAVRILLKTIGWVVALVLALLIVLRALAAAREGGSPPPPPDTQMIATPIGAVAVHVSGPATGPRLLIVHGTAAWGGFWRDSAKVLAASGWRVIAVDLPPFGWSAHDAQARYDRISQADRLAAVIGATGTGPATVIAHSFGAGAATELALRHPDRVRGLVLVDAALGKLDPTSDTIAAKAMRVRPIAELVTAASLTNPAALPPLVRSLLANKDSAAPWIATLREPMRRGGTTTAYAAWLPNLFTATDGARSRSSAQLKQIRVPVAIIWGGADTVTPIEQGQRLATLLRATSLTVLPGVGHIPHIENPRAFDAALDQALRDCRLARRSLDPRQREGRRPFDRFHRDHRGDGLARDGGGDGAIE